MVKLLSRLFARFRRPAPPAPVVPPPAVLGLEVPPPTPVVRKVTPPPMLQFRGFLWVQKGTEDARGRLTFVRDVVVDGRIVQTEVQLLASDLSRHSDGTFFLGGRQ